MTPPAPSVPALAALFTQGAGRIPASWELEGPARSGLWWKAGGSEAIATPALLRMADGLLSEGERVGALLATEPRYRERWLALQARRLFSLGERREEAALCREIDALGLSAVALREALRKGVAPQAGDIATELALFGAPADQPAAAPGLLRVLSVTAPWVEGGRGVPAASLAPVDRRDPELNWLPGRLLQVPSHDGQASAYVLSGGVPACGEDRMAWVLETPWVTLLSVLVFTAEAWAAERQGGLTLELAGAHVQHFAQPPEVTVVITLSDGREVLCGSLGELCLRSLDALGMAAVPSIGSAELDKRLGPVIAELLRAQVWAWRPEARTRYVIGEKFSFDCYRGQGHRFIGLGAERLSQTLRSVAVSWAKARADRSAGELGP